ncbi:hypothetical protein DB346_13915 [Verrucomicrobia bacterium LW23]|nr:hypothetical protein DB346_13915 [Verrucomicrobia bacterium LW23]
MAKTQRKSFGDIEICWQEAGWASVTLDPAGGCDSGRRCPVVLVHGHPFDATMWQPQTTFLAEHFRVIVPELRGYGESSLPEGATETRLETFAADILALLDSLSVRNFVLGGLSMGGQIALEIMRQAGQRIRALILSDTFVGLDS